MVLYMIPKLYQTNYRPLFPLNDCSFWVPVVDKHILNFSNVEMEPGPYLWVKGSCVESLAIFVFHKIQQWGGISQ